MPRWVRRALARIHQFAAEDRLAFTQKAFDELRALPLDLDALDACQILLNLRPGHCAGRVLSRDTGQYLGLPASRSTSSSSSAPAVLSSRSTKTWTMTTRKKVKADRESRRVRAEQTEACPICGTMMRHIRGTLSVSVNGESMSVPNLPHLQCPKCRERVFSLTVARQLERRGVERYRAKHELLSTEDIRAIRHQLGLTQVVLANLLRLGTNTISRWESGRTAQTGAMDVLLRLIRDVPGSLEYLQRSG
jgi:putative zinc finger/helix-turn-helix YgiT family protein